MSGGSSRVVLPCNLDSVEFCPFPGLQSLLAVGSYTLQASGQGSDGASTSAGASASGAGSAIPMGEGSAQRVGSVELFKMSRSRPTEAKPAHLRLHHLISQESAAVLDLKWAPPGIATSLASGPLLAQAAADGCVSVYTASCASSWEDGSNTERDGSGAAAVRLETWATAAASSPPESGSIPLCLALDWSPSALGPPWCIGVSKSDGGLATLDVREGGRLVLEREWNAHGFEAWTCAFDRWRPQVMYSGGDDCCFLGWDLRTDLSAPLFRNRKSHGAGVTSMQCSPHTEHLLATGSYDEELRLWDVRMLSRPVESCHVGIGGGVWRIKWHEKVPCGIVVAGMHGGLAMVHVGAGVVGSSPNGDSAVTSKDEEGGPCTSGRKAEAASPHCFSSGCATVTQHFMESDKALIYGADWWVPPEDMEEGETAKGRRENASDECLLLRKRDFIAVGCSFYEKLVEICQVTNAIE